ncbi:hypothetical protein BVRB_7g163060 [Beta vulgaris subsp. vulgaris]|uniref:uncharacterized protein LOC104898846 isoform X2 n=1 Tax=Beta vulgaris subsp. vulgaris TaxID=3555 RepID=UPI0005401644|nr:uncharacterized protein LOC104898846 isoform X2 [Beta vulgaris subsp. vulgaris]KMT06135.1 hypothetical protein BVRB_7g163060 [Beta vulgaris subsp. vulgaris]
MAEDESKRGKLETAAMAEVTEIEVAPNSINAALIFHLVYDVLAFLLYMHQQIPSMLQDMTIQFDTLQTEYKESEILLTQSQLDASSRRKCIGRKRDVKLEIRRFEKLMNTVSGLQTALLLFLREVPNVEDIIFVLGTSPRRPHHVYEFFFPHEMVASLASEDMTRNRTVEVLSRKVIRALISKGVGSATYKGPSKLFLLVKAPTLFNMPLHFLPKRDFQYSKKILPLRLQLRSKSSHQVMEASSCIPEAITDFSEKSHTCSHSTWFQCRHVIKGIALANPSPED